MNTIYQRSTNAQEATPEQTSIEDDQPDDVLETGDQHRPANTRTEAISEPTSTDDDQPGTVHEANDPHRPVNTEMPNPPDVWPFNKFLTKLSAKINEKELDILKGLFYGDIGRGTMEKITTPRLFFEHMRTRAYLNQHNLIPLQSVLMELKKQDLIEMAMEYAQREGNVTYFKEEPDEQDINGLKVVNFHVKGLATEKMSTSSIETIRSTVSFWLQIPLQHVIIIGIERCSSVMITILIPDMYADILLRKLKHNHPCKPLCDIGIDVVQIGEEKFNILGVEAA